MVSPELPGDTHALSICSLNQPGNSAIDSYFSGIALSRSVESNQHHGAPNAEERRAVEASRGILVES